TRARTHTQTRTTADRCDGFTTAWSNGGSSDPDHVCRRSCRDSSSPSENNAFLPRRPPPRHSRPSRQRSSRRQRRSSPTSTSIKLTQLGERGNPTQRRNPKPADGGDGRHPKGDAKHAHEQLA
ncbi:unnamed protein product, partial [Ixodes persulcatus]